MNSTTKLQQQLAAVCQRKKNAGKEAAKLRKQIADKQRELDNKLACAIGRVCLAQPLTPDAIAFLRFAQGALRDDRAAQVRGMLRDAEARARLSGSEKAPEQPEYPENLGN